MKQTTQQKIRTKKIGVFLYNRFFDSINQSNLWLYINDYLQNNSNNEYKIYLISYEDKNYPLTDEQNSQVEDWEAKGLIWFKLKWNSGTSPFAKGKDILKGFSVVAYYRIAGCKYYVSLASVAGTFVYLYSIFLGLKYYSIHTSPTANMLLIMECGEKIVCSINYLIFLKKKPPKAQK